MAIIPTDKIINIVQATKDFASSLGAYIKSHCEFTSNKVNTVNYDNPSNDKYCSETALRNYIAVGTIVMMPDTVGTIPDGWLKCDGETTITADKYPDLVNICTTTPNLSSEKEGYSFFIKAL